MCPYGSVSLDLWHEDRPRNPELKDSEEQLPIRALESGASTADSRIVGLGGAFGHPAAGRQRAERRVKCVLLIDARFRRRSRSGVLERLFAALREQETVGEDAECFGFDSTSVKVHPDGTGARKTNGPQSIGKSRGGWYAKIHMVSASGRQAVIFRLSAG